jgi:lysophospholipase L1-like esterase
MARSTVGQRLGGCYHTVALLLLNTVLLLAALEIGAHLILATRPQPNLAQEIAAFKAKMLQLSFYAGQEWSAAYWEEHFRIVDNWSYAPYVLWRTRPVQGAYINVAEDGLRHTENSACSADSYRIDVFGGSTMWGYGVADNMTIASYLQAALPDRKVCVVNQGEVGFNSTQGVIKLLRLLQTGEIPDLVIFYDGSNDIALANRTSTAGAHFYLETIAPVVQGDAVQRATANPTAQSLRNVVSGTALYRLIIGEPPRPQPNWAQPPFAAAFLDAVTNTYLANIRTVHALSAEYGFEFAAFLQPVLPLVERPLSDEEQRFMWETPGGLADLFLAVYPRWQAAADELPYLHDFAHLLDGQTVNPMWIDFNHLTAWGNLVVGNAIAAVITPMISE